MNIILTEKIVSLGNIGDQCAVKPGYARNYLLPQKKAVLATPENIAKYEAIRKEQEKVAAELLAIAQEQGAELEKISAITIPAKIRPTGKLFGSIGVPAILKTLKEQGIELSNPKVTIPDGTIKQSGKYKIAIQLHDEVVVNLEVNVVAEQEQ